LRLAPCRTIGIARAVRMGRRRARLLLSGSGSATPAARLLLLRK